MRHTHALSNTLRAGALAAAAGSIALVGVPAALASSHSDAPLIKLDPQANLTDVYAFVGTKYDDPSVQVLNIVANVRPFSEPSDGPHYERFSSDARYSLHVTEPLTGATFLRFDFEFSAVTEGYKNTDTIISNGLGTEVGPIQTIGDARQNYTQTYTVTRAGASGDTVVADGVLVAPPNVGNNVTPLYNDDNGRAVSGAQSLSELDPYTTQAIAEGANGEVFFAGPRDDGFYGDVPGIFDLLNVRILDNNGTLDDGLGQDGNGTDGFKGFNVLSIAIQIPLSELGSFTYTDPFFGPQTGVGVFASVSRRAATLRFAGDDQESAGPWVQVNRLGNPLFNEVLVALEDKDRYNSTDPSADAQYAEYAQTPEIAELINAVYGTNFQTTGRADLAAVFIPDVLRVATTTGPVPLSGQPGFSRFGFVGGDTTGGVSSGWPNGRRLGDDVIDIALTAVASGPAYDPITVVGDNVAGNDLAYNAVFPYGATPHSGTNSSKDREPTGFEMADVNNDGAVNIFDVIAYLELFSAND